jgi:hypothetical protein
MYHLCNASLKTRYIGGSKAAQRRLKGVAYLKEQVSEIQGKDSYAGPK